MKNFNIHELKNLNNKVANHSWQGCRSAPAIVPKKCISMNAKSSEINCNQVANFRVHAKMRNPENYAWWKQNYNTLHKSKTQSEIISMLWETMYRSGWNRLHSIFCQLVLLTTQNAVVENQARRAVRKELGYVAKMEQGIDLVEMSVRYKVLKSVLEMVLLLFPAMQETTHAMVLTGLEKLHNNKSDY